MHVFILTYCLTSEKSQSNQIWLSKRYSFVKSIIGEKVKSIVSEMANMFVQIDEVQDVTLN